MPLASVVDLHTLPAVLTLKHVQAITGLSRDLVYRLARAPGFPAVRFGRTVRVPRDAFLRWFEEQAGEGRRA